jgi:hypothetical protein
MVTPHFLSVLNLFWLLDRDVRIYVHMRFFKIPGLKRKNQKTANLLKFNFPLIGKWYVHNFKILIPLPTFHFAGKKLLSAIIFPYLYISQDKSPLYHNYD